MMKRLSILLVILLGSFFLSACTVVETASERRRRQVHISKLQMKMLVEDWDYFWLMERNTALTQWHPWIGI
jgi:hypothetical protein